MFLSAGGESPKLPDLRFHRGKKGNPINILLFLATTAVIMRKNIRDTMHLTTMVVWAEMVIKSMAATMTVTILIMTQIDLPMVP